MNHIESAKPKKLYDINVLRTLSIIGVVFFHAYGMMYATHFQSVADMYRQTYSTCLEVLLGFRMPVLIFSSGFLYSYLLGRGKYKDTSRYVYHKFKRLIIPYFVFATIYSLMFMHNLDIATIIKGNLAHLWFITMLFWCFCAIRLFSFGTADNQQPTIVIRMRSSCCIVPSHVLSLGTSNIHGDT